MRKVILMVAALVAVLALSVGAFAYPMVAGTHALSTGHAAAPATVNHPKTGDDNSTGNQTNENETQDNETAPVPPPPEANETENETEMAMVNVTIEHNVTVAHVDNTTYVNGTLDVVQNGTTLVSVTFQIVAPENGTANVTINATQMSGSMVITVHGLALYNTEDHSVEVFGIATATTNGSVQWMRGFDFEVPGSFACDGSPS